MVTIIVMRNVYINKFMMYYEHNNGVKFYEETDS